MAKKLMESNMHTHIRSLSMGHDCISGYRDQNDAIGKGAASFANHKEKKLCNASFFRKYNKKKAEYEIYLKANRVVHVGEEIFVNYGNNYWKSFTK
jgi:hypothetical protein